MNDYFSHSTFHTLASLDVRRSSFPIFFFYSKFDVGRSMFDVHLFLKFDVHLFNEPSTVHPAQKYDLNSSIPNSLTDLPYFSHNLIRIYCCKFPLLHQDSSVYNDVLHIGAIGRVD